jgi:hypothetical protein
MPPMVESINSKKAQFDSYSSIVILDFFLHEIRRIIFEQINYFVIEIDFFLT